MTDTVAIVSSIITTVTTVVLAFLTWRYVQLTQRMAEIMTSAREPFVDIELDFPAGELRLAFLNSGGIAARKIVFNIEKDCSLIHPRSSRDKRGICDLHPIVNGISYLPAGQRLIYAAGRLGDFKKAEDAELRIHVSYEDDFGKLFTRTVHYDLRQLEVVLFESFQNTLAGVSTTIREAERETARRNFDNPFKYAGMTPCPSCNELISSSAKKCHFCHEWVTNVGSTDSTSSSVSLE